MINKQILNYKITRLIGEGGMAKIYEAEHTTIGNKVAIKILDPVLAKQVSLKERFIQEARIMASLNNPYIIKVFDFVHDENQSFYAIIMELLDGENLSLFIKRYGALTKEITYDLMHKILNAFDYAHRQGLVHRDVKPANIFVTEDKNIKILDFGIAKLYGLDTEMTTTGTQMGTPAYMSPEQVKDSKNIDQRSDIYSLGVLMYYMLKGSAPYDSSQLSNFDIYTKIVNEALPSLAQYPQINKIIEKATAKNPSERYQTCSEFAEALNPKVYAQSNSIYMDKDVIPFGGTAFPALENEDITLTENIINTEYSKTDKDIIWQDATHGTFTDTRDGKSYKVVKIGKQIWMAENLNYTQGIPHVTGKDECTKLKNNKADAAWCYYDNKPENGNKYGALYTWAAALKVAPKGWHLPAKEEWESLLNNYGGKGEKAYKALIKGRNSDLNILFGGWRGYHGNFTDMSYSTGFWSATEYDSSNAWYCYLYTSYKYASMSSKSKSVGLSVRLLRD